MPKPRAPASIIPPDFAAHAELAQAVATIGRLLPKGLSVTFYRPSKKSKVAVEVEDETSLRRIRHWAHQVGN